MIKKLFLLYLLINLSCSLYGQVQVYKSGYGFGGTSDEYPSHMATDNSGNIYISGLYGPNCDFDPSANTNFMTPPNNLAFERFIAKYNNAGGLIWKLGLPALTYMTFEGLKISPNGDIYLYGNFSTGIMYSYIVVFNSNGQQITDYYIHGSSGRKSIANLEFTPNGDFYTVGSFKSSTIDIDPGPSVRTLTNSSTSNSEDVYLAKYNSSGTFLWGFNLVGNDIDNIFALTIDSIGRPVIGGNFRTSLQVDSAGGTTLTSSNSFAKSFIVRYSSNGAFDKAWTLGNPGFESVNSLTSYNNEIIFAGYYFDTIVDLNPGPDTSYYTGRGNGGIFLGKLDTAGNFSWGQLISGPNLETLSELECNSTGEIYLTGNYIDSAYFEYGPNSVGIQSFGGDDGFIAKYSNQGAYIFANSIGSQHEDTNQGIEFTFNHEYWIFGRYKMFPVHLDPQNPSSGISNAGVSDIYFAKYSDCAYPVITDQPLPASGCVGGTITYSISATGLNITYQWQQNDGTGWINLSEAGIYSGTTTSTLNLNPVDSSLNNNYFRCIIFSDCGLYTRTSSAVAIVGLSADTTLSYTVNSISSNQQFATYQWLDCDNNYSAIFGDTNQIFYPALDGNYAVEISVNGCPVDTSACYAFTLTGLPELSDLIINLHPVPAADFIRIETSKPGNFKLLLFDISGRPVVGEIEFNNNFTLNLSQLRPGMYILRINENNLQVKSARIIKQ